MRMMHVTPKLMLLLGVSLIANGCGERTETTTENTYIVDEPAALTADGADAGGARIGREAEAPAATDWQRSDEEDPISGERVLTASRNFDDGQFRVRLDVVCRGGRNIDYVITLPQNGLGSAFAWDYSGSRTTTGFQYRADGKRGGITGEPRRYNNQLTVTPFWGPEFEIARASKLVVQLRLTDGEPVFTIDQSGQAVGDILQTCLSARQQAAPKPTPPAPDADVDVSATKNANETDVTIDTDGDEE